MPRLVPHDQLMAAGALLSLRWSTVGLAAPAAAGLVIATAGVGTAYLVDLATFLVSIALLARLRPLRPARAEQAPALGELAEGAAYVARRPDLVGTYLVDLMATAFALPTALFPFLAEELDARWALGLLHSASAAGALAAAATSGAPGSGRSCSAWRSPAPRTGWATPSGPPSGTARSRTGCVVARPGRSC